MLGSYRYHNWTLPASLEKSAAPRNSPPPAAVQQQQQQPLQQQQQPPATTAVVTATAAATASASILQQYSPSIADEVARLLVSDQASPKSPPTSSYWATAPALSPSPIYAARPRPRHLSSSDSGYSEDLDLDIPFQKHGEDLDLPFHANGVDREVDELDFKLIQRRCSPNPSRDDNPLPVTCVPYIPPTNAGVGVANATEQPMTIQQLRLLAYRQRNNKGDQKNCVFCKNNGEAVFIYTSHCLKDENGRVLCPILREYKCPNCNAFGDNAHTLKYCPLSPDMPGMGALRTARTSTGKRRTLKPSDLPERLGRRPPPSQLLPADKFHKVIAPLL